MMLLIKQDVGVILMGLHKGTQLGGTGGVLYFNDNQWIPFALGIGASTNMLS